MNTTESRFKTDPGETPILKPQKKDPHLMDFLTLLAKNKKVVFFMTFFLGIGFLAFTYVMPQTFTGESSLIPPEKQGQSGLMSFLTGGSGALDLMKGAENPAIDMFKNVLDSRQLSEQIAKDPRIRRYFATFDTSEKGIVGGIHSTMLCEALRNSIFTVDITIKTHWLPDPAEKDSARLLVPYLAKVFVDHLDHYNRERLMTTARNTRIFVESEYNNRLVQLDSAYANLQAFQEEHKTISLTDQLSASVTSAALLGSQQQQLEMQLGVEERDMTPNSGRAQMLRSQLEETKRELKKYDEGGIGDYVMAFKDVPTLARQLAKITREVKLLETLSAYLRQQLEQERINEQRDLPSLQVLDAAITPEKRSSPSRFSMLFIGLFSGLIASILYVAIRNYYDQIATNPQEHSRYLNFIAMLKGKRSTQSPVRH
jgi:tyrosine-protein kinase Etk/Wzc